MHVNRRSIHQARFDLALVNLNRTQAIATHSSPSQVGLLSRVLGLLNPLALPSPLATGQGHEAASNGAVAIARGRFSYAGGPGR